MNLKIKTEKLKTHQDFDKNEDFKVSAVALTVHLNEVQEDIKELCSLLQNKLKQYKNINKKIERIENESRIKRICRR
jgi:predicted patatin/cPLA2 family phospholipase